MSAAGVANVGCDSAATGDEAAFQETIAAHMRQGNSHRAGRARDLRRGCRSLDWRPRRAA